MNKQDSSSSIISYYSSFFSNLWRGRKPLCLMFSTDEYDYLYDIGTNKIVRCDKDVNLLLKSLFLANNDYVGSLYNYFSIITNKRAHKALVSLESCINKKNILKTTKISAFSLSKDKSFVEHEIQNNLGMITLEITQDCNLRCGYCIYRKEYDQKREHNRFNMREEIIIQAIQYLHEHSMERKEVAIGFYGGEPLQRFYQIKKAVNYAKAIFINKSVRFTITTNGTLIDRNIAEYLFKEKFSVLLSIDGPREIHDSWRKYKNGTGSYEHTLKGLKVLCESFKNETHRVSLSMVYAPPFSDDKVANIADFIDSIEWLPENTKINITYPRFMSTPEEKSEDRSTGIDYSLSKWARSRFMKDYLIRKKSHPLANGIIEDKIARLLKRPINNEPIENIHLNGCCIPGGRKSYISAEGNIKICERIGLAPDIGTVAHGVNISIIDKKYIDEYAEKSLPICSSCWLVRLCPVCYEHAFHNYEINMDKKGMACFLYKASIKKYLADICALLEHDNKGLDYLRQWKFS